MKVSDINQKVQLEAYINKAQANQGHQQARHQEAQGTEKTDNMDRVQLSSQSRLIQKINGALETQDPERAAKVNAIREELRQGTYQVDPEKVAQGMLTDLLKDLS